MPNVNYKMKDNINRCSQGICLVMLMFCIEDRCVWWGFANPAVETAGYKMIDVMCSCRSAVS